MQEIRFLRESDRAEYVAMAAEFYASPAVAHPVDAAHFERAFDEMLRSRERAVGLIIEKDGAIAGYVVLVRFYSQEAGGEVIWIDEIYVRERFRAVGLGHAAFERIFELFPDAVAFRLEVEPENRRAWQLYKSLGFAPMEYASMIKNTDHKM